MNDYKTDLQKLRFELRHPEWLRRRKAIESLTHVYQRPDLSTVEILIEIAQQLMGLNESYALVNATAARRLKAAVDQGELEFVAPKPKIVKRKRKG